MRKRHVRIKGKKVPLERKKLGHNDLGRAYKGTSPRGNPERRRIELQRSLRGLRQTQTLVHEMLHQLDIRLHERTILQLEDGIVDLVTENPEVFHELLHGLLDSRS